ncbi:MAG: endonuclease domain-containing protein [Anaerolineae bacterium]
MSSLIRRMRTSLAIQESAEVLRKQSTPAEALLWQNLRGRRLAGAKFRRQHPIGPYVADFYCAEQHLVVELDGPVHLVQAEGTQGAPPG